MIQKTLVYIGTIHCQFLRTGVVRKWKKLRFQQKVFKNNGLDVIIECNMKLVNYLDDTFNLNNGTYQPYQKPDHIIQYIYVESNHPPNIIKQIPKTIKKRLSHLSSNEEIFNESAPFYEDKLHQSGYQQKLRYNPVNTKTHSKRNHKRNIIWFNPPFNRNVSTKIGKYFLSPRSSTETASRSAIVAPKT